MQQIRKNDRMLAWHMLQLARILYAMFWKVNQAPKIFEWLNKLVFMAEIYKITRNLRERRIRGLKKIGQN